MKFGTVINTITLLKSHVLKMTEYAWAFKICNVGCSLTCHIKIIVGMKLYTCTLAKSMKASLLNNHVQVMVAAAHACRIMSNQFISERKDLMD